MKCLYQNKPDALSLGESRTQALNRFKANERSLVRKGIWTQFQNVVQEYIGLDHAELVPPAEPNKPVGKMFYLPMHGVKKECSSTAKLRVVFDASTKSSTSISLNDTLMVGPTLYPNLTDVLIRFRSYPVAIAGDISKMYRAVQLTPGDRDLHRFLWQPNLTSAIQDYRMKHVTFGVASSPYLATQVLQQTAHDFGEEFTLAKPHIFSSFYVDDCLAGADSPENAIKLQQQLRYLLQKGGFDLRKWKSNSQIVLDSIPATLHDPAQVKALTEGLSNAPQKTLGMV